MLRPEDVAVAPPLSERLLLRHGPGVVIPLGLFAIGAGVLLMRAAATGAQAGWLTLLPGCLLAGTGLGLTNTPVTNTATGALPPERAGMAAGMDMSARMIALSVNIAPMGFILLQGVRAGLAPLAQGGGARRPRGDGGGRQSGAGRRRCRGGIDRPAGAGPGRRRRHAVWRALRLGLRGRQPARARPQRAVSRDRRGLSAPGTAALWGPCRRDGAAPRERA
ncbi:hypothetical protein [Methylobacterium sp. WL2]|uniref:hypothetical protein n=1 Tax=Methylobacterium sp. WL2 TaxID=2603902 RepID=UPI00164F21A9